MRTLAIDLGARRVGLALSDEGGRFATPYDVLTVTSPQHAMSAVLGVAVHEGVQRLAVGLPLNMDHSLGPAARATIAWGSELASRAGLPLVYLDERLSSFDAEQQLAGRRRAGEKLTHAGKKRQLDAIAAATFLQEFLDGKLTSIEPPIG